ncbi:MAG: hypothetical protein IT282_18290 [Bacteroidetes bacterium]|nr:hypothetical protein [Bacteroidota bacterium]
MKQRIWMLLLCTGVCLATARAQVVRPDREDAGGLRRDVFGLGVHLGSASGIGLSFRHHLPSTLSYQLNGGIIKVDDRLLYAVGAELQADLSRSGATRFFVAGAIGYYHAGSADKNEMAGPGRVGVGLGGEMFAGGGFHATIEALFTYFTDGTVLPLPQLGLHYYF